MADVTPAAQELADEKGVDLSSVEGSGKDGRVLVEDVEAVLESGDDSDAEASDEEVVGEVAGDELVVGESEQSVTAYEEHPHVAVENQSPEELKDFSPDSLVEAGVVDAPEEEEVEELPADAEAASEVAADEDRELLSQDSILSRGLRERGFYNIPEQVNPYAKAEREAEEAAAEEAEPASEEDAE